MAETQNNGKLNVDEKRMRYGGGPHGLGDPDDLSLRNVEKDVLIKKIIRDRTRDEKCIKEVADFKACCKEYSFFMVVKCRKENNALKSCSERWYNDDDFNEECKKKYLAKRSEYRRTGIRENKTDSKRLPVSM